MIHIWGEYVSATPEFKLRMWVPGETTSSLLSMPASIEPTGLRPSMEPYEGRLYICGATTENLVVNEEWQVHRNGIAAPANAPTLAGSGSGSLTGNAIGYLVFVHKIGNRVVHYSNLSAASATYDQTGDSQRDWTNIPTTSPDSRVTHVRGYLSEGGSIPRLCWERALGVSSVSESMTSSTLAFQDEFPNDGADPVLNMGGVPFVRYCRVYHKRMWYAGDPAHPYRLYYSEIGMPEAVGEYSYFDLQDRERISGLGVQGDRLLVFCDNPDATYSVQGWSDGSTGTAPDLRITKLMSGVGCSSHWSILNINGRLWYAARDGVRVFDGSFSYLQKPSREYWANDSFVQNYLHDSDAFNDPRYGIYGLRLSASGQSTKIYIYDYHDSDPVVGGAGIAPYHSFDTQSRTISSVATLPVADGSLKVFFGPGGSDNYVRYFDDDDPDDDGDAGTKTLTILTKTYLFDDPGGDRQEGKTLVQLWSYMRAESNAWTVYAYGGDDSAEDQAVAQWSDSVAASAFNQVISTVTYYAVAKDVHFHIPSGVSGRGFAFKYVVSSPQKTVRWRGMGGIWVPGPATRGYASTS